MLDSRVAYWLLIRHLFTWIGSKEVSKQASSKAVRIRDARKEDAWWHR